MKKEEFKSLAFIKASRNRYKVILVLSASKLPLTPSEVASKTGLAIASVSRSLKELKKQGFVNYLKEGRIRLYYPKNKTKIVLRLLGSD